MPVEIFFPTRYLLSANCQYEIPLFDVPCLSGVRADIFSEADAI